MRSASLIQGMRSCVAIGSWLCVHMQDHRLSGHKAVHLSFLGTRPSVDEGQIRL